MKNNFKTAIQSQLEKLNVKPIETAIAKLNELPTYEGEFSENDVLIGVNKVLTKMGKETIHPSIMNFVDKDEAKKAEGKPI